MVTVWFVRVLKKLQSYKCQFPNLLRYLGNIPEEKHGCGGCGCLEGRDREVRRSRVVILPAVRAVSGESFLFLFIVEMSRMWMYKVNSREIVMQDRSDTGSHGTAFIGRLFHWCDYHRHEYDENIYVVPGLQTRHRLIFHVSFLLNRW
jgi:hypothetical protein